MHGKTKIQASWWSLLNGSITLKIRHFVCGQQLARSWQDTFSLFEWGPSSDRESCNSLQMNFLCLLECFFGMGKRSWDLNSIIYFGWGLYIWEMWLIMNLKGCWNLKIPNNDYIFPKLWIYLGDITWYTIVAWIFAIENKWCTLVHACYKSLQLYCVIMQWHHYLGYLQKQKMCARIYVGRMHDGGKCYNVVGIPICHFVQRYSYGGWWLVGSH